DRSRPLRTPERACPSSRSGWHPACRPYRNSWRDRAWRSEATSAPRRRRHSRAGTSPARRARHRPPCRASTPKTKRAPQASCSMNPSPTNCSVGTGSGNDELPRDGATIHLIFQLAHGWPRVVPGQAAPRGAAPHDLVGQKRIKVLHGIDLRGGGIRPRAAERREAALHLTEHVARLLTHGFGTGVATTDDALAIACAALTRLGAAG